MVKSTDDRKSFCMVRSKADGKELQKGLTNRSRWAITWWVKFNIGKSKIMQMGRNNPNDTYIVMGSELTVTTRGGKDLGVSGDRSLETSTNSVCSCGQKGKQSVRNR